MCRLKSYVIECHKIIKQKRMMDVIFDAKNQFELQSIYTIATCVEFLKGLSYSHRTEYPIPDIDGSKE